MKTELEPGLEGVGGGPVECLACVDALELKLWKREMKKKKNSERDN